MERRGCSWPVAATSVLRFANDAGKLFKVSPGCAHCYAETFAERFRGVPGHPYEQEFDLRLVPEKLVDPFTWSKTQMVFVNSMSDLFHEDVDDEYIELVARSPVAISANLRRPSPPSSLCWLLGMVTSNPRSRSPRATAASTFSSR